MTRLERIIVLPLLMGLTFAMLAPSSSAQIRAGLVNLATMVTGRLPFANLTQGSALSVLGVTGNSTADVASIAAGSDAQVLRRSGTSLAFGTVATDGIADSAITDEKLRSSAAVSVIGRSANSSGAVSDITASANGQFFQRTGNALAFSAIGYPVFIRKASDETVSSNATIQADDELVLPIGASETWEFSFYVGYTTTTAADFKAGLKFPTTPTQISYEIFCSGLDAVNSGGVTTMPTPVSFFLSSDAVGGGPCGGDTTPTVAVYRGFLRNSTNAGNIVLWWAQNTSTAVNTTVKAGSYISARRLE